MDTERKLVHACLFSAQIEDTNLGVGNTSAEPRLGVRFVLTVAITSRCKTTEKHGITFHGLDSDNTEEGPKINYLVDDPCWGTKTTHAKLEIFKRNKILEILTRPPPSLVTHKRFYQSLLLKKFRMIKQAKNDSSKCNFYYLIFGSRGSCLEFQNGSWHLNFKSVSWPQAAQK